MIYHILLNDGSNTDVKSNSAADAMCIALERNPGRTITKCFTGYQHPLGHRFGQQAAYIEYEIPAHKPVLPTTEQQEIR